MLSLLTKIDDQVIDALEFHGGPPACGRDLQALERKTRAYLAPTLASIRSGRPDTAQPRCVLAAALGRRLRASLATQLGEPQTRGSPAHLAAGRRNIAADRSVGPLGQPR
jgi:hypothetical protein